MRLITNSIDTNDVEETDDAWLIHDVPIVRPMELSGGYVPQDNIKETARQWSQLPATLNHPRNQEGKPIAANRKPETHIGISENASYDGEHVRVGTLELSKDRLDQLGGEAKDIEQALENGETIDVSSQYAAEDAPPGEYDGEHRANVERIIRPDSIAILPNKQGKCSVKDGCGINPEMVANSEISIPMESTQADDGDTPEDLVANKSVDGIEYTDVMGGDLDESEIPNDDYESHYMFDADTKSESGFPLVDADGNLRAGNVASAFRFRGDAPDEDKLVSILRAVNDEFDEPPIDPENFEQSANSALEKVLSFVGKLGVKEQTGGEPAQSGATANNMDREKYISEITANSPLTEESLSERCDDGLEAIHSDVMAANEDDDGGNDDDTMTDNNEIEELREEISEVKEMLTANERQQKEEIAQEIVANSAEYEDTESVLEDFPTEAALSTKKDSVTDDSATMPGMGATANADFGDSEQEFDVGSGVLTE